LFSVAIIGCGRIGFLLEDDELRNRPATHAGAFSANRNTKITSACDIDKKRLNYFGEKYKIKPVSLYSNYKEMLKKENPDIVSIATWTNEHCKMVIDSARTKSVKGIYCEKPIALNLKDANRMIKVCRDNGVALLIGHERRFDANFVKVKKMIEQKKYGKLKMLVGQVLSGAVPKLSIAKFGGGTLFHDGTHLFDLAIYYCGAVEYVIAVDDRKYGKKNIESGLTGIVTFKNGTKMMVEGGGEREYFKFDLDLQFERGRILIGNSGIKVFESKPSGNYTGFRELQEVEYCPPKKMENSFVTAVKELVRAVKKSEEPMSSGREARDALELIIALYKSASLNGKKVYIVAPDKADCPYK